MCVCEKWERKGESFTDSDMKKGKERERDIVDIFKFVFFNLCVFTMQSGFVKADDFKTKLILYLGCIIN